MRLQAGNDLGIVFGALPSLAPRSPGWRIPALRAAAIPGRVRRDSRSPPRSRLDASGLERLPRRSRESLIPGRKAGCPSGGSAGSPRSCVDDLAVSLDRPADDAEFLSCPVKHRFCAPELVRRHHCNQSDTHVEGAQHLFLLDAAQLLQMGEDGRRRPGAGLNHGGDGLGQYAGQVFGNAAAGNVGHAHHQSRRR